MTESIRQPATVTRPEWDEGNPQLARARDDDVTPVTASLPDTESVRRVVEDVLDGTRETCRRIWSGEIWDIQPPSPRELVERGRGSVWADSGSKLKVLLVCLGVAAALAWSVPWYTLAVLGQRFGRAATAASLLWLIWVLF